MEATIWSYFDENQRCWLAAVYPTTGGPRMGEGSGISREVAIEGAMRAAHAAIDSLKGLIVTQVGV